MLQFFVYTKSTTTNSGYVPTYGAGNLYSSAGNIPSRTVRSGWSPSGATGYRISDHHAGKNVGGILAGESIHVEENLENLIENSTGGQRVPWLLKQGIKEIVKLPTAVLKTVVVEENEERIFSGNIDGGLGDLLERVVLRGLLLRRFDES